MEDAGEDDVNKDLFTFSAVCLLWLMGEFFLLPLPLLPPPDPRNMDDIAAVIEFFVARASWPEKKYYNYIMLYYVALFRNKMFFLDEMTR